MAKIVSEIDSSHWDRSFTYSSISRVALPTPKPKNQYLDVGWKRTKILNKEKGSISTKTAQLLSQD